MPTVLVGTASVHTTAAACDYLAGTLEAADTVVVLTVDELGVRDRDAGDAANVARTRLVAPTVETRERAGEPAAELRAVAAAVEADELVVGATRGDPDLAGDPPGATVRALLAESEWPVVVLPPPAPA